MLDVATEVFTRFGQSGIHYCHWKSNGHLELAFTGDTDFDLLVAKPDRAAFELLMLECGLKRRVSTTDRVYPAIEDFLGFDYTTGNMIHLHVHFELVVGRKLSKNYRIPLEEEVLNTAVPHNSLPIYIIRPEYELAILVIRSLIKLKFTKRAIVSACLGHPIFPDNIEREFAYLLAQIDEEYFEEVLTRHFNRQAVLIREFLRCYRLRMPWLKAIQFRRSMIPALEQFRRVSSRRDRQWVKLRRMAQKNSVRGFTRGGMTLAFVGADGAGKSSTLSMILRWLSWKLSVRTYYMGIPKMRLIYFLDFCIRVCTKLRLAALARMLSALKWIYCARSRYVNHRRAQEYRNQGAIAVFDRYPIRELWEMQEPMDGPRIDPQSTWKSMEEKYYDMIRPPDYLFVLQVTPEESLRRKQAQNSFQDEQILRRKIHVINQLQADGEKIFTFDTSVALDQNVLDIKRQLWNLF